MEKMENRCRQVKLLNLAKNKIYTSITQETNVQKSQWRYVNRERILVLFIDQAEITKTPKLQCIHCT